MNRQPDRNETPAGGSAREVEEELRFHLESRIAEYEARGMTRTQAEQEARQRFGDERSIREKCDALVRARERRARLRMRLSGLLQDARYGWRSMRRSPGFAAVAVLSLALGIGANTAIFGLVYAVLFERLRIPDAKQLVQLAVRSDPSFKPGAGSPAQALEVLKVSAAGVFSWEEYEVLRGLTQLELAAYAGVAGAVGTLEAQEMLSVTLADGRYFEMLRIRPVLGRLLTEADERTESKVAVIGESYWERRLGRDPSILGQPLRIGSDLFTVVGVTPRSYRGLMFPGNFDVAVPMAPSTAAALGAVRGSGRPAVFVVGRVLRSHASARAELDALYARCCAAGQLNKWFPAGGAPPTVEMRDISHGQADLKSNVRAQYSRVLYILMSGVVVLLLLSCANVGNLLLARARTRERELALRHSLGARGSRLVQQMLTESTLLALLGAAGGLLLARWGTNLLAANLPANVTAFSDLVRFRLNPVILGFTVLIAVTCSLLFGVIPALRAVRVDLVKPLKDGGRGTHGRTGMLDHGIVAVQVALALLLVSAGGLLVQTLRNLRESDPGFAARGRLLVPMETRGTPHEASGLVPLQADLLAAVRAVPGVRSAALASAVPIQGGRIWVSKVQAPGLTTQPDEDTSAKLISVTPGYFRAMGIDLTAGRDFNELDSGTSEPVAIVSDAFARSYFAGRDPIGEVFQYRPDGPLVRIVGVTAEAVFLDLRAPAGPLAYLPLTQTGSWPNLVTVVDIPGDAAALATAARNAILEAAPGVWIRRIMTMEESINESLARERLVAALASLFGILALCLAAVGLYGVMAYHVNGRTAEIGTRMALGAQARGVLWLVLRHSIVMLTLGFLAGLPLALAAGRLLQAQLFGVAPWDPTALAFAVLSLSAVGVIAVVTPAWRALRVDPLIALRAD